MLILEYKLRTNKTQQTAIDEAIRAVQFIRNKAVRLWMDGRGVGQYDLQALCSQLAKDFPFAARLNSMARQASADRAWQSIARFYANCKAKKPGKKGYPAFSMTIAPLSIRLLAGGWNRMASGSHNTLGMGIGSVRLIGTRSIETFPTSQIKRVRLVKRADGYYVQFAVQAERHIEHVPTGKQIGIDVGLKAYYTDSSGHTVAHPRYLRKAEQRLKRLHRRKDRKPKGSKNRKKAIKRLAKGYLKVSRQRKDFAAKAASALVSSHDLIAYEDLQVSSLVKNRHLAKSIYDAGWYGFLCWVRSYGLLHGIPVVAVSPRFTTQDCSGCGFRVKKTLSMRTHICPGCGLILDRDHNAALNILELALNRTAGQAGTGSLRAANASGQGTSGGRKRLRSVKLAG